MHLEDIITNLNEIKAQILGWPDNIIDNRPSENPDEVFLEIEENLKSLLSAVSSMEHEAQEKISPFLQEFRRQIVEHYQKAKERLHELKAELGQGKQHIKAIKAYSKI